MKLKLFVLKRLLFAIAFENLANLVFAKFVFEFPKQILYKLL